MIYLIVTGTIVALLAIAAFALSVHDCGWKRALGWWGFAIGLSTAYGVFIWALTMGADQMGWLA